MLIELANAQLATGDLAGATQTIDRAGAAAQGNRDLVIAVHLKAAEVDDREGNPNQATWERDQARQLAAPD